MSTKFYLSNTTVSIPASGNDFNLSLTKTYGTAGSVTVSVNKGVSENSYGLSVASPFGANVDWETGEITVKVNVTTANTSVNLKVSASRTNSSGTILETSGESAEVSLGTTGVKTLTIPAFDWATGVSTNRLIISYIFTNTNTMAASSVVLETNTINTEIVTPITIPVNTNLSVPKTITSETSYAPSLVIDNIFDSQVGNINVAACVPNIKPGFLGYRIERSDDGMATWNIIGFIDGGSFNDTNVVGGETYHYRIMAGDGTWFSAYSNVVSILYEAGSIGGITLNIPKMSTVENTFVPVLYTTTEVNPYVPASMGYVSTLPPSVSTTSTVNITSELATVDSIILEPSIFCSSNISISAPIISSSATGLIPNILAEKFVVVYAAVMTGTVDSNEPSVNISTIIYSSYLGMNASAITPSVSISLDKDILVGVVPVSSRFISPSISTSVNITGEVGRANAGSLHPSLVLGHGVNTICGTGVANGNGLMPSIIRDFIINAPTSLSTGRAYIPGMGNEANVDIYSPAAKISVKGLEYSLYAELNNNIVVSEIGSVTQNNFTHFVTVDKNTDLGIPLVSMTIKAIVPNMAISISTEIICTTGLGIGRTLNASVITQRNISLNILSVTNTVLAYSTSLYSDKNAFVDIPLNTTSINAKTPLVTVNSFGYVESPVVINTGGMNTISLSTSFDISCSVISVSCRGNNPSLVIGNGVEVSASLGTITGKANNPLVSYSYNANILVTTSEVSVTAYRPNVYLIRNVNIIPALTTIYGSFIRPSSDTSINISISISTSIGSARALDLVIGASSNISIPVGRVLGRKFASTLVTDSLFESEVGRIYALGLNPFINSIFIRGEFISDILLLGYNNSELLIIGKFKDILLDGVLNNTLNLVGEFNLTSRLFGLFKKEGV